MRPGKTDMKKILSDQETVKVLATTFKCDPTTVRNALHGRYHSDLVHRIRHRAIQIGLREKGEEIVTYIN